MPTTEDRGSDAGRPEQDPGGQGGQLEGQPGPRTNVGSRARRRADCPRPLCDPNRPQRVLAQHVCSRL
jgi:hypothetical protein